MSRSTMVPQAAFITFTLPSSLYVAIIRTGMGKIPSVSFSFVLMVTSPCRQIDRMACPVYNYIRENQKFKYWQ